uniref:Peroniin-1.3 n=1 Tax=Litoria peronii TaxID=317363 RepID=PE13_LITPE|nr:RecName: Full=Peroniin-1.3 [Litoria peronii]
QPWLPFV